MTTLQTACLPHDAVAPLAGLGAHLAARVALEVTPLAGTGGEEMLLLEGTDSDGAPATWLVTAAGHALALEQVVDETRLDLLAVAPPDRILALIAQLAHPSLAHPSLAHPSLADRAKVDA